MKKSDVLKIGLDLNAIALIVCEECYEKVSKRLKSIEEVIAKEPIEDEEEKNETVGE